MSIEVVRLWQAVLKSTSEMLRPCKSPVSVKIGSVVLSNCSASKLACGRSTPGKESVAQDSGRAFLQNQDL